MRPERSREALGHEAAQGAGQVAMVEQVVGELVEDVVGVEVEAGLGAVPARVGEAGRLGLRPQTEAPALAQSHALTLSQVLSGP